MADGNLLLHANHCNRPSEGVYNNTVNVKFSNVASEGAPDSSTCTISTVDQDDELTAPVDKAKSMEKIMSFNKPWSSKNHRQPCPKPTFLSMIALAGCLYIYTKLLLPGGALPKWLLVRHSNVPEGNSIQQSGILCPTFLPSNTTKYISVTSQVCHATAVLSSLSTDCDFPFPFYEPASEGVSASMHQTNLHPTNQMTPCNKRLTSWVYNHQSQVVFLFLKTHINPLSLLQRFYHNISSSSTVTSCTVTNTYHVEAEGGSTTSINPVPIKARVGLFASKEKPKLALNFDYISFTMEKEKSNYLVQNSWHNMIILYTGLPIFLPT